MTSLTGWIEKIKQPNKQNNRLINTKNKLAVAIEERDEGTDEVGERDIEGQTCNYKISKSWGWQLQNREYGQ